MDNGGGGACGGGVRGILGLILIQCCTFAVLPQVKSVDFTAVRNHLRFISNL